MALADYTPTKENNTGIPCSIGNLLNQLDDDDRLELESWLDNPAMQHRQIWRALMKAGYAVSGQQVGRHRNASCRCSL